MMTNNVNKHIYGKEKAGPLAKTQFEKATGLNLLPCVKSSKLLSIAIASLSGRAIDFRCLGLEPRCWR